MEEAESLKNVGYELYGYKNPLKNYQIEYTLKYYKCIKCYLEYHLFTPSLYIYIHLKIVKDKEKRKKKGKTMLKILKKEMKKKIKKQKMNKF